MAARGIFLRLRHRDIPRKIRRPPSKAAVTAPTGAQPDRQIERREEHEQAVVTTIVLLCAGAVAADPAKDIGDALDKVLWTAGPSTESRFAFTTYGVNPLGAEHTASLAMNDVAASHKVIGLASTGTDAFVATDITAVGDSALWPS
jgi:hypothetical protein